MKVLQRGNFDSLLDQGTNPACGCVCRGERGNTRNVVTNRCAANRFFVVKRFAAERCVNHQINLAGLDQVHDIRAAFIDLEDGFGLDARGVQCRSGSARGGQLEAKRRKLLADCS